MSADTEADSGGIMRAGYVRCDGCHRPLRRPFYEQTIGDVTLLLHDHYCRRIWLALELERWVSALRRNGNKLWVQERNGGVLREARVIPPSDFEEL